jgi:hypothetical protein
MDSQVAYVINTTPKYFYLLRLHLILLQRYAAELEWPIFLATEVSPESTELASLTAEFPSLRIISLSSADAGFFESRLAASKQLPSNFKYIFPIQEDFLLEARPLLHVLSSAIKMMEADSDLDSIRVMPCPGPSTTEEFAEHEMVFSYQATIWRRVTYESFFQNILEYVETNYPGVLQNAKKSITLAVKVNLAEIHIGQTIMKNISKKHLCVRREHRWPNAVYLAPWPYRPTAVVNGVLQTWAKELGEREGFPFS